MIFKLLVTTNREDYIKIEGDFSLLSQACTRGELQFMDKKRMQAKVSLEGGLEIPDVLVNGNLVFISRKCKQIFDKQGIDYLFYKEILVVGEEFSIHETFYLLVVPKVDCISLDSLPAKGELWDYHDGLMPLIDSSYYDFKENYFTLDKSQLGRYEIFRIFGLLDDSIYVTDKLKNLLDKDELSGIHFLPIEN